MEETYIEIQVVQRMIDGDMEAFDQLYHKYKNIIYHSACLLAGNSYDAEDITQETFSKVYQYRRQIKDKGHFKAWMLRIMNRTAWRLLKKGKKECPEEEIGENNIVSIQPKASPETQILQSERQQVVRLAIRHLKYMQRMTVILYYYQELPVKQIAQVMGCMEAMVRSRLFYARRQLKKELLAELEQEVLYESSGI